MPTRPFPVILCALALGASTLATAGLQPRLHVETPPPVFFGELGSRTFAATAGDGRAVTWALDPPVRTEIATTWPAEPVAVETWGDTALVHFAGLESLLLEPLASRWYVDEVPADWRLPTTTIGDAHYRVFVDLDVYLLVYTAPGPGTIVGLLDFPIAIGPASGWDHDGDRAALAHADGVRVVDLSIPVNPTLADDIPPPAAGLEARDVLVVGRRVYVLWDGLLQAWNVENAAVAWLVDEAPCDRDALAGNARWVVAYTEGASELQVFDVSAGLTAADVAPAAFPLADPVAMHGDHVVTVDATGLRGYRLASDAITDAGEAWFVLNAEAAAAGAGNAWLQGAGRRYRAPYRGAPDLAAMPVPGATRGLALRGDRLYTGLDPGGVRIDDVADADAPVPLATVDPGGPLLGFALTGPALAMLRPGALALADVTDPADPGVVVSLGLAGDLRSVGVVGATVVVGATESGAPGRVDVVAADDLAAPRLASTVAADLDGHLDWVPAAVVARPPLAHVLCRRDDGGVVTTRTLTLDVGDPDAPTATWSDPDPDFWCYAGGVPVAGDLPVRLGPHHVAYRDRDVTVYAGPAGGLDALATWTAPGAIHALAAADNILVVATEHRLDVLTFSDDQLVAAPAPGPELAVRATPNPFNPRTSLVFTMPAAGRATVAIHDARGRLVRSLAGSYPAGEIRRVWDGTGDDGRPLPSGLYLLRVTTPGGVATGRCALVR